MLTIVMKIEIIHLSV